MSDLITDSNLADLLKAALGISILAPGFLIVCVRSYFVTGRVSSISSATLEYLMVSCIYFAASIPILLWFGSFEWYVLEAFLLIVPILLGVLLGGMTQWEWPGKVWTFLSLNPVTAHPTGWDRAFGGLKGSVWVIVTMKDHGPIHGLFSTESNASTMLEKRDIYIEEMWGESFTWIGEQNERRGIWISEDQIVTIELISKMEG